MTFTTIPHEGEISDVQLANIEKWIAALRSGKYAQHRKSLTSPEHDAFCCLGVACEENEILFENHAYIFGEAHLNITPQYSWFLETYGFEYDQHVASSNYEGRSVIDLNDQFSAGFDKIADVIEAVFINRLALDIEI